MAEGAGRAWTTPPHQNPDDLAAFPALHQRRQSSCFKETGTLQGQACSSPPHRSRWTAAPNHPLPQPPHCPPSAGLPTQLRHQLPEALGQPLSQALVSPSPPSHPSPSPLSGSPSLPASSSWPSLTRKAAPPPRAELGLASPPRDPFPRARGGLGGLVSYLAEVQGVV